MGKYQELADMIIENVGGKDNVNSVVHCITRLRFRLKDDEKANTEVLKNMDGVVTVMQAGGQYQVVIGNQVPAVYEEVVGLLGINPAAEDAPEEKMSAFNRLIDIISGSFQPFLGAMAAGGMIKGLNALLVAFGVLAATDGTYLLLNAVGDAIFTFLPIVVGMSAARKFKLNEFVGLVLGAALMYPSIQLGALSANGAKPLGTLFKGTIIQSDYFSTFLHIPFIAQNYSGTVVPIIFTVWFASLIQKRAKKMIPELLQTFFVPFFVLLIATPIALLAIGPVLNIAINLLSVGFQNLLSFNPIIFMALVGFFWQVMVIFGLHWALVSIAIVQVGTDQFTQMLPGIFGASFAQIAVVFALWLKFRNQDKGLKTLAIPAIISGIAGVTEPAIYGISLKRKKAFLYSMIGAAAGGAIVGLVNAKMYTMGGLGIFMLPSFVSPTGDMKFFYVAILSMLVSAIIAFLLTYFFYKETAEVRDEELGKTTVQVTVDNNTSLALFKSESISAPVKGQVRDLADASDPVFASGAMGKGVVIDPSEGAVYAPVDAEVVTIFPTGHAVGLRTAAGAEILIHVGMDTVQLNGEHFEKFVADGAHVKAGDLLIKFDKAAIEEAGYLTETPILVTNTASYTDVLTYKDGQTIIETIA